MSSAVDTKPPTCSICNTVMERFKELAWVCRNCDWLPERPKT